MKPDGLHDTQYSPLPGQTQIARVPSVSEVVEFDAVVNNERPQTSESQKKMLEEKPKHEHIEAAKYVSRGYENKAAARLDACMKEMERKAHIISTLAAVSCLLAFVIREFRVANNVTWVFCLPPSLPPSLAHALFHSLSLARALSLSRSLCDWGLWHRMIQMSASRPCREDISVNMNLP